VFGFGWLRPKRRRRLSAEVGCEAKRNNPTKADYTEKTEYL